MSKRRNKTRQPPQIREEPQTEAAKKSALVAFLSETDFEGCCKSDYIRLDQQPEIVAIVRRVAKLIGMMTVHLMKNTDDGDVRIRNELSRFLDVTPCTTMNRSQFMEFIVAEMLLTGNAVVRPKTRAGILKNLQPIPHERFSIMPDSTGYNYTIMIDGETFKPENVLHFPYNPDRNYPFMGKGLTIPLKDLAETINAGRKLEKEFMTSKYYPSVIVKADGMVERFSTKEGRKQLVSEFIETSAAGEPWIVPADQIEIKEVRSMTLADLAIDKTTEFDLKKLAALFGVPPFLVGAGEYSQEEWNNFISTEIHSIALSIAQEMTRKLIFSPDWYIRLNYLSLLDYDIEKKASVYLQYSDRAFVNGNEARDAIGMPPGSDPALKEFNRLENYIPASKSGDQKKLIQE